MRDFRKENINDLVEELLGKTSVCGQNLHDRVKINGIFSEFDSYTHENFQKFIDMSQQRYKSIKSGNHLERKLLSQKNEYNDISSQILLNRFYNNNEIESESKKLLKKMNRRQNNKEISELRKYIIQKTKDFTKKEVLKRERLASAAMARRHQSELDRLAHRITRRDLVYRPESMQKRQYSRENMPIVLNEDVNTKNEIDEYLEKKKFFDDLMENDCKNLNENITDYKDFVKDIEKINVEKDEDIVLPGNKKDNYGHTFTFLTDGIKMLSYKEEQIVDNKPKRVEEPKIDIIKLMRYTKRGNKKWFKEELKKKSAKRLSAIPSKSKALSKLRGNSSKRTNRTKEVIDMKEHNQNVRNQNQIQKEQKNNNINNLNNNTNTNDTNIEKEENEKNIDFSNINMNKANSFTNFKNTIKTVKNEAEKSYFLNENFDKKKDSMDLLFNNKVLPNIEDYEYIIQKNMLKKSNKPKTINNEKNDLEDEENINSKENKNKELTRHHLDSFSKKKLTWTKEDFLREQSKKKDKDVLEETKKYLKEVKEVQKKANKEQSINQCISIFNKYLNEHNDLYKKKNEISHKKRIKKNVNKNLIELQNKKEEEKKKKKEEERLNYLELFEKMRENLDKEDQDEEDIKLNFQYKLCKGFVKETNLGLNAYNDYLELLQLAKERKIRGVYDQNNMVEKKEEAKKPVNRASAYDNLISNVAKLNTYIDSSGQLAQYKNPLAMLSKRRTVVGTNIMKP